MTSKRHSGLKKIACVNGNVIMIANLQVGIGNPTGEDFVFGTHHLHND